jgi:hypothetical protein
VSDESGQASVEWVGLVLMVALVLGAVLARGTHVDGRSFGGFLAHRFACAVEAGRCDDGDAELASAYGSEDADLVRRHAPNIAYEPGERELPVDFRRCRSTRCSNASLDRDADLHRTRTGERATVFTRVVRRGGRVYIQYWLYYPDSNTALMGSDGAWEHSVLLPAMRQADRRRPALSRLSRRRLGGLPGQGRPGWDGLGPRHRPRRLPGLQAADLPQPLGRLDRLDARLARQPRRPRAARPALAGAGPRARDPEAVAALPGPRHARAQLDGRGAEARSARAPAR